VRERYAARVLTLLFLANLLNFFDRVMPAIVIEDVRIEFGLSDTEIGLIASAVTAVYAIAALPLGRLADRRSRKKIMGYGVAAWSLLTAATGAAVNLTALVLIRLGVGIGEASYAPAANSLIADLYPGERRSRATAVFMLGLPLGLLFAYFSVGAIVEATGSWRVPFVLAAIPGLLLAALLLRIREPARGAAEDVKVLEQPVGGLVRRVASVPTMWWLIVAFLGYNFAASTVNAFTVPLLQRYFGLSLTSASVITGIVIGLTGLLGLTVGGRLADRASRRSRRDRVVLGAACLAAAVPLSYFALSVDKESVGTFAAAFALGWLPGYVFYTCCYPAVSDVVEPGLRATAVALLFALGYLFGGAAGPLLVGALSDSFARDAMIAAGAPGLTTEFRGIGLNDAMVLAVPISLAVAAAAMLVASRTITRDRERMLVRMSGVALSAARIPMRGTQRRR
jgi:MFS family permease